MKQVFLRQLGCALLCAMATSVPSARASQGAETAASRTVAKAGFDTAPGVVIPRHELRIAGKRVRYRAEVERSVLPTAQGKPGARVVSVAYLRDGIADQPARPVLFVFNGGPGSASLWLHLGLVGPRRIDLGEAGNVEGTTPPTTPPFHLVNNADSVLDVADVVLFDPPGTGASRVLPGIDDAAFYGVEADANATATFIQDWLQRHHRLNSPRYLMGESYGSVRAAAVAKRLAGGPFGSRRLDALTLSGVILLGQAMDMRPRDDDRSSLLLLPTLAALNWYHHRDRHAGVTLEQQVQRARDFAANDYLGALYAGSTLAPSRRAQVATGLAQLTGLSQAQLLSDGLHLDARRYQRELLRARGLALGLYDGRFTLPVAPDGGDPVADDPAMAQYTAAFVASIQDYLREELHADLDVGYQAIDFSVNGRWDYGSGPGVAPSRDFGGDLAVAMRRNPELRLFVGMGYYDLVTPLGDAEYLLAHDGFDPARIQRHYYRSGHMAYLGRDSRQQLAGDLRAFLQPTAAQVTP